MSMILTMLTAISVAQSQRTESEMQRDILENKGYLFMENSKLLYVMDETGMGIKTQHDMTLTNGTIIKPDGSFLMQSGTLLHLKNGQIMDMNGIKYKSERSFLRKTHRKKVAKKESRNMHSSEHPQYNNGSSSHHH